MNWKQCYFLWASYQIRKIARCTCAGNAGNVFPHRRLQRKPLVSDPGMHHGTCVTHVPWCMSGSLTRGGGENVPGIPAACATRTFTYLVRGTWCVYLIVRVMLAYYELFPNPLNIIIFYKHIYWVDETTVFASGNDLTNCQIKCAQTMVSQVHE